MFAVDARVSKPMYWQCRWDQAGGGAIRGAAAAGRQRLYDAVDCPTLIIGSTTWAGALPAGAGQHVIGENLVEQSAVPAERADAAGHYPDLSGNITFKFPYRFVQKQRSAPAGSDLVAVR